MFTHERGWLGTVGPELGLVSAARDELLRLVQDLPEDQVPQALTEIRRHLKLVGERPRLPAFFAIAPGDGKSIAEESDELLREGFGR